MEPALNLYSSAKARKSIQNDLVGLRRYQGTLPKEVLNQQAESNDADSLVGVNSGPLGAKKSRHRYLGIKLDEVGRFASQG